jgi:hypothetical protein
MGDVAQTVNLFWASEGLDRLVGGLVDGPAPARRTKPDPDQPVILAQTVGRSVA